MGHIVFRLFLVFLFLLFSFCLGGWSGEMLTADGRQDLDTTQQRCECDVTLWKLTFSGLLGIFPTSF
jgi:hypothetical protein